MCVCGCICVYKAYNPIHATGVRAPVSSKAAEKASLAAFGDFDIQIQSPQPSQSSRSSPPPSHPSQGHASIAGTTYSPHSTAPTTQSTNNANRAQNIQRIQNPGSALGGAGGGSADPFASVFNTSSSATPPNHPNNDPFSSVFTTPTTPAPSTALSLSRPPLPLHPSSSASSSLTTGLSLSPAVSSAAGFPLQNSGLQSLSRRGSGSGSGSETISLTRSSQDSNLAGKKAGKGKGNEQSFLGEFAIHFDNLKIDPEEQARRAREQKEREMLHLNILKNQRNKMKNYQNNFKLWINKNIELSEQKQQQRQQNHHHHDTLALSPVSEPSQVTIPTPTASSFPLSPTSPQASAQALPVVSKSEALPWQSPNEPIECVRESKEELVIPGELEAELKLYCGYLKMIFRQPSLTSSSLPLAFNFNMHTPHDLINSISDGRLLAIMVETLDSSMIDLRVLNNPQLSSASVSDPTGLSMAGGSGMLTRTQSLENLTLVVSALEAMAVPVCVYIYM